MLQLAYMGSNARLARRSGLPGHSPRHPPALPPVQGIVARPPNVLSFVHGLNSGTRRVKIQRESAPGAGRQAGLFGAFRKENPRAADRCTARR